MSRITTLTGSPLVGNPITATIVASVITGNISFHRVKVQVIAALDTSSGFNTIEMSSPVESGETIDMDISSALRAVAEEYTYTPNPTTYPRIKFQLKTWEEYMKDGITYTTEATYFPSATTYYYALQGAFSDMERIKAGTSKKAYDFCRKPTTSPQILCVGETFAYTNTFYNSQAGFNGYNMSDLPYGPTSIVQEITVEGSQQIGDVQIYALPADTSGKRYQFRFINGLGVLDSFSITSLRESEVSISSAFYTISRKETFNNFSRGINRKSNDYETWKLSSGPLDDEWYTWFIHEFLMAEYVWIYVEGIWLPCHIIVDDTVSGYSEISPELREVSFSVRPDIYGAII